MANFKVKNGLQAGRYLLSGGTETAGSEGYALSGASYDGVSFSTGSQDISPREVRFNADGTKMYISGATNDAVYQYTLSTAYDVSTASYDSVSFSVASQDTSPSALWINNDGTKFYILGGGNDSVFQYSMSTAYDLSTASYDSVSFSVASQDTSPLGLAFNSDGSKMYFSGGLTDTVYQYTLSTPYNVGTASYDSVSFNVAAQETTPFGLFFNTTGTKLFVVGNNTDAVDQYSLSSAYNIGTASYDSVSYSITEDSNPLGVSFNPDGSKMYITGIGVAGIYQYSTASYTQTLDLSTGTTFSFTPSGATTVSFTNAPASGIAVGFSVEINGDGSAITWPTSVKWPSGVAPTATASKEVYAFVTTDGGTSYYGKRAAEGIL